MRQLQPEYKILDTDSIIMEESCNFDINRMCVQYAYIRVGV